MNKTDERGTEEAVVRVLRATRANEAAGAPARHSQQTGQCPHLARFAAVLKFGGRWTPGEEAHLQTRCAFCTRVRHTFSTARAAVAQEDTVLNLSAGSEETVTGLPPAKPAKPARPGDAAEPS
jgi:hypothetical protein